ncbi:hypothetical protein Pmani_011720 [Petrolisthes manimaculis]|uniref:Uncharacterized protein n=1 Tax=Petrolisthes manimaculis TaxID=1843537 RepID=A0AAE1PYX9_9EUCA|nr:hypothetical protein Pmani_011720 [Petrolisthes manimaculis]
MSAIAWEGDQQGVADGQEGRDGGQTFGFDAQICEFVGLEVNKFHFESTALWLDCPPTRLLHLGLAALANWQSRSELVATPTLTLSLGLIQACTAQYPAYLSQHHKNLGEFVRSITRKLM